MHLSKLKLKAFVISLPSLVLIVLQPVDSTPPIVLLHLLLRFLLLILWLYIHTMYVLVMYIVGMHLVSRFLVFFRNQIDSTYDRSVNVQLAALVCWLTGWLLKI
jgi:hypothetical protein